VVVQVRQVAPDRSAQDEVPHRKVFLHEAFHPVAALPVGSLPVDLLAVVAAADLSVDLLAKVRPLEVSLPTVPAAAVPSESPLAVNPLKGVHSVPPDDHQA